MEAHLNCEYCQADIEQRKSPIKYVGGKSFLVPTIKPFWHNHQLKVGKENARLVEPFAGSGAITLAINPKRALLNDLNYHLMNFYRWIQQQGLSRPIDLVNTEIDYYRYRKKFNDLIGDPKTMDSRLAAYLFYYLNRTCFRGLCRFNAKGQFNVPYGNYKTIHYLKGFNDYQRLFRHWKFKCVDFERLKLTDTDLIYIDPPYDGTFTDYNTGGFTWEDQERLAVWLSKLPGTVLVSNSNTDRIVKLYKSVGLKCTTVNAPRRMDAKSIQTSAVELFAGRNLS